MILNDCFKMLRLGMQGIRITVFILISILCIFNSSCKKIIQVKAPYTNINVGNVFNEDGNAIAVLTGLFTQMARASSITGSSSISLFAGLASDELTLYSGVTLPNYIAYYSNSLLATSTVQNYGSDSWASLYSFVYQCNAAIEGLNSSVTLSEGIKNQLLGEAKFLRAFCYFYLVNSYGEVPLALNTDYKVNSQLARSSIYNVYQQIVQDLIESKALLSEDYLDGNLNKYPNNVVTERVRPTKWAAAALLARAYLYTSNWTSAEASATELISKSVLYDTVSLGNVFLKNNREAIWQLQPVNVGANTEEAKTYILSAVTPPTNNSVRPVYLSDQFLSSFEINDQRRKLGNWVNSVTLSGITYFFPNKYKNVGATVTEYLMALRLGEQYLIRSEARVQLGDLNGAKNDLNIIRFRARLEPITTNNRDSIASAILHERQVELFTEWGSRWFDLKRTEKIDAVMNIVTSQKTNGGVQWKSFQQLYPILVSDVEKNRNLMQNFGY